MGDIKKNKTLKIEYKNVPCTPEEMRYIRNIRNRVLIEMAYKTLIEKTKNEMAG